MFPTWFFFLLNKWNEINDKCTKSLSKINADEEAASVATATEGVSSSAYAQNDVASYADAYAQYYAQYLPEITANERNYYQDYLKNAQRYSHKTLRKQDYASMMKDALGEEAAVWKKKSKLFANMYIFSM